MAGFKNDVVIAQNGARIGDETITGTEQASVQFSESGGAVALLVNNTSGTAGSSAYQELRIENTSAEMVFERWAVGSSDSWAGGFTGASPAEWQLVYKAAGDASPTDNTNVPLRADIAAGQGRVVVRSGMAITSEGERSGEAVILNVQNVETAAGSDAQINVQVALSSGGFGTYSYLGLAQSWIHGVDRNSSNEWSLQNSTSGGAFPTGFKVMNATINGEVTFPNNPAFLAFLGTTDANVTGDGTIYTLGSGNALTEVFDRNSDFNTNGTFTAPVTGIYRLTTFIRVGGVANADTIGIMRIVTTNGTYVVFQCDYGNVSDVNDIIVAGGSILADMTAGDTATVEIQISNGTIMVDIEASGRETSFSGELVA